MILEKIEEVFLVSVTIDYDRFDREKTENLERFVPVAEYFSKLWQKDIIMDAPHGKFVPPEETGGGIYVHFFSHPHLENHRLYLLENLCGIEVPTEGIKHSSDDDGTYITGGHDVGMRFACIYQATESSGEAYKLILQNSIAVGYFCRNHIYILFDLACYPWDGDRIIFWAILMEASKVIVSKGKDVLLLRHMAAHKYARPALLALSTQDGGEAISSLSSKPLRKELARLRECLEETRAEYRREEEKAFGLDVRLARGERLLRANTYQKEFTDQDLAREFEEIHGIEGVHGIEFGQDSHTLIVHTTPVTLTPPEVGGEFPLCQYNISINVKNPEGEVQGNAQRFVGIIITEEGWRGKYMHPVIQPSTAAPPSSPCLGPDVFAALEKSTADHDYVGTIGILMTFLTLDDMAGNLRPDPGAWFGAGPSKEPFTLTPYYSTQDARAENLQRYIEFARQNKSRAMGESLQKEVNECAGARTESSKKLTDTRTSIGTLRKQIQELSGRLEAVKQGDFLSKMVSIPELTALFVDEAMAAAVFGPGPGKGEMESSWFSSLLVALDVRIGNVLIFRDQGGHIPSHADKLNPLSDSEIKKRVLKLTAAGYATVALGMTLGYLRGENEETFLSNTSAYVEES